MILVANLILVGILLLILALYLIFLDEYLTENKYYNDPITYLLLLFGVTILMLGLSVGIILIIFGIL